MEQFALDDLFLRLMTKRKECLHSLYLAYQTKITEFLEKEKELQDKPLNDYFNAIKQKQIEEEKRLEKERLERERLEKERLEKEKEERLRKAEEEEKRKRRRSMIVHIDDMSFCFGKEELQQLTGQEKEVDPQVKDVLHKMNELFKQLNTAKASKS
ncbi:hypothetical protein NEHOM01_0364 [Nematocida homosporus]|uniref:uncharacterized protein n=1 Tax=Nematocida homosporus TaxID=1912981 RepID=UPI002220D213|nr:uncharacterized protein NEHOM01_0364 [Nematocida homosporus]KAI5184762.1 hypothetical protein NEHOM01_0364 [Nematocida homosporus]